MMCSMFAALAMLGASPALAQLPEPLEAALASEPSDIVPERVALRMTVNQDMILVEIRPGGEDGEPSYTLLQPETEALLNEEQAEMWAGFQEDEDSEGASEDATEEDGEQEARVEMGGFDAEALRAAIGRVGAVRFDGPIHTYEFEPLGLPGQDGGDSEGLEGLVEYLAGEIEVDTERSHISRVRFELQESFKPNFASRLNAFVLEQNYVYEPAISGTRFAGMTMQIAGSAVFQEFDQTMQIEIVSVLYPDVDNGAGALGAAEETP